MSIHIDNKAKFGKVVLMPGDPLRAKWIAETFLKNAKLVTSVRGILGYTGFTKNNKKISVMASGMGQPSIGIYSNELYREYNVESIIRVGTCGAFSKKINVGDVIIAQTASTDFDWLKDYHLDGIYSAGADFDLLEEAMIEARKSKRPVHAGNILSEAIFYHYDDKNHVWWKPWEKVGTLGCEMESYALYCNAATNQKRALSIFTVSDHFQKPGILTQKQRQTGLVDMINLAIKVAEKFA